MRKIFRSAMARTPFRRRVYYGAIDNLSIAESIRPFMPNSTGELRQKVKLALNGVGRTPALIAKIAESIEDIPTTPIEEFCVDDGCKAAAQELADLFNEYGSDKSSVHNYHVLYASILRSFANRAFNLLEIGLGTTDVRFVSNMGEAGRPGSSL